MSRRGRPSNDVCGDCGATDPSWASINRGILLCAECCSVHRSFGRHISQVKSLHQGSWSPSLLAMVHAMGNHGVNSIWEHSLLDPGSKNTRVKKPQPKDSLHPTKSEFIRSKHMQLAYILKPSQDDSQFIENDLSKQLHASVRSPNLETSVRLLVQGADPNYFHDEKGTTPLHAAAKAGQMSQVELLVVYGANPCSLDFQNHTPIDIALSVGHKNIAQRLVECSYETTDRLIFFLCKRKPDHSKGQHYIGPDQLSEIRIGDGNNSARGRLQLLPNHLFEELTKDLYDEIDRRENEAIWQTSAFGSDKCHSVPFLPVNPQLSTTRNQGRQKLARFSQKELAALVFDVLIDAKRRQHDSASHTNIVSNDNSMEMISRVHSNSFSTQLGTRFSQISDDEPLYDSVASDDDYAALTPIIGNDTSTSTKHSNSGTINNSIQSSPAHSQSSNLEDSLRQELQHAQTKILELNNIVQQLTTENSELKSRTSNVSSTCTSTIDEKIENEFRTKNHTQIKLIDTHETEPVHDIKITSKNLLQRPVSMYETRNNFAQNFGKSQNEENRPNMTQSMYQYDNNLGKFESLPIPEEVIRRTDQVTKRIQELWMCIQGNDKRDGFVPCAERIRVAVAELSAIFPQTISEEPIRSSLRQLNGNTGLLQSQCASLQRVLNEVGAPQVGQSDYYLHEVRSSAYEIAKATKQLVTIFQESNACG